MKKIGLFFFLLLLGMGYAYAQDLPNLKHIKLNKTAHFRNAEAVTIKVVDYLFQTPIERGNKSRIEAGRFLIDWMNGTPDYTFYLEEKETNFFNTDSDLTLMYMASMTKFMLENKSIKDQKAIILGSMGLLLPYLNKQENKKSWSKELWELNDAYQKGKLAEYLYP